MSKVYLYSTICQNKNDLSLHEPSVYKWQKCHSMEVDEVIYEENLSGKTYEDLRLGKELLPSMVAGDVLVLPETGNLGGSVIEVGRVILEELAPRKIRVIFVDLDIDLRCDDPSEKDRQILDKFFFATNLDKTLTSERTKIALRIRKRNGIKLGGVLENYKLGLAAKGKEQLRVEARKRGAARTESFLIKPETQALIQALRETFPLCCWDEDISSWNWIGVNVKNNSALMMLKCLRKSKEKSNNSLFVSWDFSNLLDPVTRKKLYQAVNTLKRSASNMRHNSTPKN